MIYTAEKDRQPGTLAYFEYVLACQLPAYLEPVPPGKMGRAERDALARRLALRWVAKAYAGETSCAWHEIHGHYLREVVPALPHCDICSGEVSDGGERHELCRLRREGGRETPRLSQVTKCYCARCRP